MVNASAGAVRIGPVFVNGNMAQPCSLLFEAATVLVPHNAATAPFGVWISQAGTILQKNPTRVGDGGSGGVVLDCGALSLPSAPLHQVYLG
jgi:hypothetical protein